jgi:hypothetical protein
MRRIDPGLPPAREMRMDLIELYYRRGVAAVRATLSTRPAARRGYARLAGRYGDAIDGLRTAQIERATAAETPRPL